MTQEQKRKARPATDEGQFFTRGVMREVKRRRQDREPPWSAERLAEEMVRVGIPWTRDSVVNLETGRRKRLAAHELLALAYVLEVDNPVDLIVPEERDPSFFVVPNTLVSRDAVRAWFEGKTGPLRQWLQEPEEESEAYRELMDKLKESGWDEDMAEQMLRRALGSRRPTGGES